jgi:prolyl-tRNA synthetase
LYHEAWAAGIEMLLDDRDATPGVKLNDADLIGLPLRLTIGPRSLTAGGAELKQRGSDATTLVAVEQIIPTLQAEIARLFAESQRRVVPMPFPASGEV